MVEAALKQDDEQQIVVAIEPELPLDGGNTEQKRNTDGTVAKTEPPEPKDDLKAQFEEQKALTDRERQRANDAARSAADARREAAKAREEAAGARSEAIESQVSTVESGIAAAQAEAEAAEREYANAFAEGDAAKTAAAQRKIARAEARIARLDEAKVDLETRRTKAPAEGGEQRRAPIEIEKRPAPDDPVESYVQGRTPETAAWLRAHPEWVTDPKKNAKLTAAHYDATGDGLAPDTPEYFEHVEKFIGLKNGAPANGNGAAKPQRKQGAPVAPGAAAGGGTSGNTGREVVLSRGEAAAATDGTIVWNFDDPSPQKRFKKGDPVGVQEFARRKLELQKQGAYDRTYVEQ